MLTERTVFKKQEFEYKSADGDMFIVTYVESSGKKYVQIGREDQEEKDRAIWDVEMLLDIADCLRTINKTVPSAKVTTGGRPALKSPVISDFRSDRKNIDVPSHSLQQLPESRDDWAVARTGVPIIQEQIGETPQSLTNPSWKEDIEARKNRAVVIPDELKVKRVSSNDLI